MDLKTYINRTGLGAVRALARSINAPEPDVSRWASGIRRVPIQRATAIEIATDGAVTRQELRPDDWHLIWPELAAGQPIPKKEKEAA